MKIYEISEDNYKEVLNRLQKISNKWKFLRKEECFNESKHTKKENYPECKKEFERKSWGMMWQDVMTPNGLDCIKAYCSNSRFINIKEHSFKEEYDKDPTSYKGKQWLDGKPLIHFNLGACQANHLSVGDKVIFYKYGFVTITDNRDTNGGIPSYIYKDHFIIDRNNEILNLDEEIKIREDEWDKAASDYNDDCEDLLCEELDELDDGTDSFEAFLDTL